MVGVGTFYLLTRAPIHTLVWGARFKKSSKIWPKSAPNFLPKKMGRAVLPLCGLNPPGPCGCGRARLLAPYRPDKAS